MSLLKTINTVYGVPATYHKVTETKINWQKQIAVITLDSFANEQAKNENKAPLFNSEFLFSGSEFNGFATNADNVAVAYNKIKAQPDWTDATDV